MAETLSVGSALVEAGTTLAAVTEVEEEGTAAVGKGRD